MTEFITPQTSTSGEVLAVLAAVVVLVVCAKVVGILHGKDDKDS